MESTRKPITYADLRPGLNYANTVIYDVIWRLEEDTSIPWPERKAILKAFRILVTQLEKANALPSTPSI